MADITTSLVKNAEHVNRQFLDRLSSTPTSRLLSQKIKMKPETCVVKTDEVSGVFVVGHSIYGEIGKYPIGTGGFVLDNSVLGLLDANNYLDGNITTSVVVRVVNYNNVFKERFVHNDFINTVDTTATVTLGTGATFDYGEVLYTKVIAKNNKVYNTTSVSMTGTNTSVLTATVVNDGVDGLSITFENTESGETATLTGFTLIYN